MSTAMCSGVPGRRISGETSTYLTTVTGYVDDFVVHATENGLLLGVSSSSG
jgi:hypothetical protein